MTTSIENTNTLAVSQLEDEIKSLESQIEGSYNRSDEIRNTTLPQGASWNITEEQLYKEREQYQDNIDSIKISINILSSNEVYSDLSDNNIEHSLSITVLNDEINYLNGQIDASYNQSNDLLNLPDGASWNVTEEQLYKQREEYQDKIDVLEKSIEFLNSIKTSSIESFKEFFKGTVPKLNEEINLGKQKTKVVFVGYSEFCFINIPW